MANLLEFRKDPYSIAMRCVDKLTPQELDKLIELCEKHIIETKDKENNKCLLK